MRILFKRDNKVDLWIYPDMAEGWDFIAELKEYEKCGEAEILKVTDMCGLPINF